MKKVRNLNGGPKINQSSPLISIIVVTLNSGEHLKPTFESIFNHNCDLLEVVVIDGGSVDRTLSVINEFRNNIAYVVSEPDKGIYDAMNKGVDASRGEWLLFLNAGDRLIEPNTLSYFLSNIGNLRIYDILYGDVIVEQDGFSYFKKSKSVNEISHKMICCHQSMLIKRDLLSSYKYNSQYKISGDYDFVLRAYLGGAKFKYYSQLVANFKSGGISDTRRVNRDFEILNSILTNHKKKSFVRLLPIFFSIARSLVIIFLYKLRLRKLILKLKYFYRKAFGQLWE